MARTRTVLGLDIGTYSICAVELTGSGDSFVVSGVGWEHIPSPDMIGDTIRAVIAQNGLKTRSVVTSVSGRLVIVRYVPMMAMPQEEMEDAVRYEADKYIPYPVEDVQLACQQLGGIEGNQVHVLMVAAKRQVIDDHVATLKTAGLTPSIIDVDLFALGNAFEACNLRGELAQEGEAVAIVDIGSSKTSICIMRGSTDLFTREIYTAGNSMTDAIAKQFGEDPADVDRMKEDPGSAADAMRDAMMPILDEVGSEVRLSFDYYENQFDQQVNRVYLSGGAIQFPGIMEMLESVFELETVRFNPFEPVEVTATDEVVLREKASDMVVAFGLASRLRGM